MLLQSEVVHVHYSKFFEVWNFINFIQLLFILNCWVNYQSTTLVQALSAEIHFDYFHWDVPLRSNLRSICLGRLDKGLNQTTVNFSPLLPRTTEKKNNRISIGNSSMAANRLHFKTIGNTAQLYKYIQWNSLNEDIFNAKLTFAIRNCSILVYSLVEKLFDTHWHFLCAFCCFPSSSFHYLHKQVFFPVKKSQNQFFCQRTSTSFQNCFLYL